MTHNPPLISVSISARPKGGPKDSTHNIKATKGFTVNIISEAFVENANITSIDAPTGVSEWPISGLTKEPSASVLAALMERSQRLTCMILSDPRQSRTSEGERVQHGMRGQRSISRSRIPRSNI